MTERILRAQLEALQAQISEDAPLDAIVDAFEAVCQTPVEDDIAVRGQYARAARGSAGE